MLSLTMRPYAASGDKGLARQTLFIKRATVKRDALARRLFSAGNERRWVSREKTSVVAKAGRDDTPQVDTRDTSRTSEANEGVFTTSLMAAWATSAVLAASPASAAVDHVVAQTAAFSGPMDVLLRGALAVSAAAGSYAVFRGGSTKTPNAVAEQTAMSTADVSSVSQSELDDMKQALAESHALLKANARMTNVLELENAALSQALREKSTEETTETADAAARAAVLVKSLEEKVAALTARLREEKNAGGDKLTEADSRAAQLADQLQATQRTANGLTRELDASRRAAHDFDAKQALISLQLKAALQKIGTLETKVNASDSKTEGLLKEKRAKINELTKQLAKVVSSEKSLAERLDETQTRLDLERAGSLAAAKKKAMAMLEANDVTNMGLDGEEQEMGSLEGDSSVGVNSVANGVVNGAPPPPPRPVENGQPGEWLQAFDVEREIHYWYNNCTMETVWELPEGARVHDSAVDRSKRDEDLPKHFEGPSGLNSR